MKAKLTLLAACAAVSLGGASAVQAFTAQDILFDPDGTGGTYAPILIDVMDWAPGNAMAIEGNLAGLPVGNSYSLVTLAQANLQAVTLNGGAVTPAGFTAGTISFVMSIPELTTILAPTVVQFSTDAGAPATVNFFEIYASNTVGNDLLGTGFNDGALILQGVITSVAGTYAVTSPDLVNLDGFDTDNYPAIDTVQGSGAPVIYASVAVGFFDPNYFPGGVETMNLAFNTSLVTPFLQADPSALFAQNINGTGIGTAGGAPAYAPTLGTVNGGLNCANGALRCDFQFQADANTSFEQKVPEPGTLALLGLGLGLAGFSTRRTRRS